MQESPNPDYAIDRAMRDVKELMGAEFRVIAAELRAIRERVDSFAHHFEHVADQVQDHETRLTAIEAFQSATARRLGESRAYRRIHVPTIIIGSLALVLAALGVASQFLH